MYHLKKVLPKTLDAARMARIVLSAMQVQPKLYDCTPESVLLSVMRAASYGLEPDGGPLGHGYLVPFWSSKNKRMECQFIPGYRGLVKMARNSGEVADVSGEVVREGDHFDYELGLTPRLEHKRNDACDQLLPLQYAYAVARFRDGEKKFVVMNRAEVEAIKARSQSKDRGGNLVGPWVTDEAEMWKKTAIRRLAKNLPLAVEAQDAIRTLDDDLDLAGTVAATAATLPTIDIPQALMAPAESQDESDGTDEPNAEKPTHNAPTSLLGDEPDDVAAAYYAEGN